MGSTSRAQLLLPDALECEVDSNVRLLIDGTRAHARVESTLGGDRAIRGAYPNRKQARTGDGTDVFAEWLRAHGFGPGTVLILDVLTEGYAYGLREPGERVIYEPPAEPDTSLAAIAASLEE